MEYCSVSITLLYSTKEAHSNADFAEIQDEDIIEVEIGEQRFEPLKQNHEEQLINFDKEHIDEE